MPLHAVEAVLSRESFAALGTINTVVVDDASALQAAVAMVQSQVKEVDEVCSRFRPDSELSRLNQRCGQGQVALSPMLEEFLVAAFQTAEMTGDLVDPTVGRCLEEAGYTVTFRDLPPDGPALQLRVKRVEGWRSLDYDPIVHTVRLPAETAIDLGASAKALAADRAATAVAEKLGIAVAVDCGGDIAVRGLAPAGGWPIRVAADVDVEPWEDVVIFDGGLATSGITARRWRRGESELHHVIDPLTGLPAQTPWSMVTVAAATCLEANAAATAALIMGGRAIEWLDSLMLPARLVATDGRVHHAGGWAA